MNRRMINTCVAVGAMGFVSLFGAVSLAFVGHHQYIHSLQGQCSYRYKTRCHEASPDDGGTCSSEQPAVSSNNRTAAEEDGVLKSEVAKNYKKNDDSDNLGLTSAPERRSMLTDEKRHQIGLARGVNSARKTGMKTHYPGVIFRKDSGKWRVQFSYKGKQYRAGAAHATEEEAALAHDDFVRKNKFNRPLHFPMEGEPSSLETSTLEEIPIEERQQTTSELGIKNAIKHGLYTRYPGVSFHTTHKKWQVKFRYKGKQYYVGAFETEKEAALAHDEFVRRHKMSRPLHVPMEGERTTYYADDDDHDDEWKEQEI